MLKVEMSYAFTNIRVYNIDFKECIKIPIIFTKISREKLYSFVFVFYVMMIRILNHHVSYGII
jgi:hypothetical protein